MEGYLTDGGAALQGITPAPSVREPDRVTVYLVRSRASSPGDCCSKSAGVPRATKNKLRMRVDMYIDRLREAVSARRLPNNVPALLHRAADVVAAGFSLERRRRHGIFLSTPSLAAQLASTVEERLAEGSPVLDPAMGCGDLLLACASHFPEQRSLATILKMWSDSIWGFEMNSKLLTIGKLRLALFARTMHPSAKGISIGEIDGLFPNLVCEDFLANDLSILPSELCCIANPPFTVQPTPPAFATRQGTASAAALFLEKMCRESPELSQISMLLPEVLRCGTSYQHLRSNIAQYVRVVEERSLQRRSCWPNVDIDVFIGIYSRLRQAQVIMQKASTPLVQSERSCGHRLDEVVELRVGPIVEYRTPKRGPWRKYITARSVPSWDNGFTPSKSRRFEGYAFQPPFVVVRRTSRPDRAYRAVASVIVGSTPVAVENHLIVLKPKDDQLSTCQNIVRALKDEAVNEQLDNSMRCRHLTLPSLARLQVKI
jgi:hypothetical protein